MEPLINEFYPGLRDVSWVQIGDFPTKISPLTRFGNEHGFDSLFIKRDDKCHQTYGGNKIRKLEYVLGDALDKKRKLLITLGAVGSNQVLATGIFGKMFDFNVMGIVMDQPISNYVRKNLLADKYYEVDLKYTSSELSEILSLIYNYSRAFFTGKKPYLVLPGASSARGNLGFVNACFELKEQIDEGLIPEPDYIICTAGSLGTASGLELGCRILNLKTKVIAIGVAYPDIMSPFLFSKMVNNVLKFIRKYDPSIPKIKLNKEEVSLIIDYIGEGYAHSTKLGLQTIGEMRQLENIQLDPTYTGKALGGGIDWMKKNQLTDKVTLFWNTYNSRDLSEITTKIDYHSLPKVFYKYFENPTQEEKIS